IRTKAYDEALVLLDRLSEEDPSNLDISLQKTHVLVEKKAFSDAIQMLLPVVEAKPKDVRLKIYLASLYEENREVDHALAVYQGVLDQDPNVYDARIRLGYLYFYRFKNIDEALIQGELAKQLDPQRVESYLFTGLVLHDSERFEEAVEAFLEGLEMRPSLPDLHFHLGATFDKMNRFDDMVFEMEKAITLDAEHANALNYLGYTYADKGIELDKAIDLIKRALAVRPDDGYFIDSLGWAYYKKGMLQDAIDLLQKAVMSVPDDPVIHEHLGEVYLKNNRIELARKAWERSLELDPENNQLMLRYKEAGFGSPSHEKSLQKIKNPPPEVSSEALAH
ncbi:MAG: tetratricopeptide repeat protein, partial [bacterium]